VAERVASDNEAVDTHRGRVSTVGRTGRVQVELPEAIAVDAGEVLWCSLAGDAGFARVAECLDGTLAVRRVSANRRRARTGDGADELREWLSAVGLDDGDAVHVDEITEGHAFGLRPPGRRVVYAPLDPPDPSLAEIAREATGDAETGDYNTR